MLSIKNFDHASFIKAAEELLRSDETLMALELLDMLPGYFRDNPIKEISDLKREIQSKIATASFYATDRGCELETTDETCASYIGTLRARLIVQDVKICNENNIKPVVWDHAPGENWLAVVLEKAGCNFWYEPVYVNHPTHDKFKYRWEKFSVRNTSMLGLASAPNIFSSCEVIEHLHRPEEIRFDMERYIGKADIVHVSTPKYTFAPNVMDWRTIGNLGHLRTWTPKEFNDFVASTFYDYIYAAYDSQILHARLFNPDSKFEFLKINYEIKG